MQLNKFFLIIILLSLNSCFGFCHVEASYSEEAKRLYDSFGTYRVWLSQEEARKIFGDCYRFGDIIYANKNIYKTKYILVRMGEPLTYESEKSWPGF
ncbi:MAG: hypothetical protein ACKO46_01020 [Alphaproteobacteria bacterium]